MRACMCEYMRIYMCPRVYVRMCMHVHLHVDTPCIVYRCVYTHTHINVVNTLTRIGLNLLI